MSDVVRTLLAVPVAVLLILGGLAFLLLAVVGNISGKIEPGPKGRIASAALGVTLLIGGLGLHFAERTPDPPAPSLALAAQPAAPNEPRSSGEQLVEKESNDQVTDANDIAFGGSVLGKIATTKDRDIFRFVAPVESVRVVLRKRTAAGFYAQFDIYDGSERHVIGNFSYGDQPITVAFESVAGGTYYVFVKSSYDSGPYELVVRKE